jgi:hypothetical protein
MAITQAMVTSFKVEILDGVHAFGTSVARASTAADTFKIALFTSLADLSAATTAYTAPADPAASPTSTNEVSETGTAYDAGGKVLTVSQVPNATGTTAWLDFADVTWSAATISAAGALIYNSTQNNKAVAVLSFAGTKTSTDGDFTIIFPAADSTNAIIRIA